MRTVSLEGLEDRLGPADVSRPLTEALGLTNAAINYYELEHGESFAYGFHAHEDQEEVFYIQTGTVTFRTAEGPVRVGPRELVRFAPGEFQRGVNRDEDRVTALAIGAPQSAGETEIRRECPDCDRETEQELELTDEQDAVLAVCEDCGSVTGRFE